MAIKLELYVGNCKVLIGISRHVFFSVFQRLVFEELKRYYGLVRSANFSETKVSLGRLIG